MSLKTNLNQSPYFDDFDETKNFHRVLFKPSVAVQARELTQLQSILQNQIERFGSNILTEGTIISGGNFVEENNLSYVKINDIAFTVAGAEIATDVNQYIGLKAVGVSGVEGIIITAIPGFETQNPDLSTIYIRYTKSNVSIRSFSPGESIQLYSKDGSGNYTIPGPRIVASVLQGSIGSGYGVRCGNGIIYQRGNFIRFTDGLTIVSKYSPAPDGVVVGFETIEEIIDSNSDSSLLDNANGFNNENAPGADRLKLTPRLVVKTLAEARADDKFFAIQEYANGKVIRRKLMTQYNQLEKTIEQRTVEESGNYTVDRFPVSVVASPANTQTLDVVIGAGLGYIQGKRVELLNDLTLTIPEANSFSTAADQNIITNYGNYVEVENMTGVYDIASNEIVNLRNSTDTTTLGTARVRTVTRFGSNFRVYLYQISMLSGNTFADVRKIKSTTSTGISDIILVNGNARLTDPSFNRMYYPLGRSFIRSLDSAATDFIYRTTTTQNINSVTLTITLSGTNDVWPYTPNGILSTDERAEFIVVANANSAANTVVAGEILTVEAASIDSTGKTATLTLNKNPGSTISVTSYYNVKREQATVNQKTLQTVYVKLAANTNAAGVNGPWSLGIPDVYELVGVWKGDASVTWETLETNAANNSPTNRVTSSFLVEHNANDSFYGISYLTKKRSIVIGANDKIIVRVRAFNKDVQPGHFFTVDSYPVDDITIPLPADKIRTENIPIHTTSNDVKIYLRDVIDLRPYAANTAAYAATAAAATTDPATTLTFTNLITPAPNKTIETTYSYYLGRNDLVVINAKGDFDVIQGTPSESPSWPAEPDKGLVIGRLVVSPYPSLPASVANRLSRPDYGVNISSRQPKRYTMKDIGGIEKRLNSLEYYVSLSSLENSAKDLLITDGNGLDRFKNGIFVDNFENLFLAEVNSEEFNAGIDPTEKNIHPAFRQYPLDLRVKSVTNATNHVNAVVTMPKVDVPLTSISQPYASGVKNLTTSFYKYNGQMAITPEYDSGPDAVIAPDITIDIDLTTPFIEFTEELSRFVPLSTTSASSSSATSTQIVGRERVTTTTTSTKTTTTSLDTSFGQTEVELVGDFVSDVSFSPFMRSRDISIRINGLRPGARHYFFFDDILVDDHVASAVLIDGVITRSSNFGAVSHVSDSSGTIYAVFRIPEGSVYVGDRTLLCMDVNDINDIDAATSSASTTYSAYNFSVSKTKVTTSTRPPKFELNSSTRTTTSTTTTRTRYDPLAQSFIIDQDLSDDTDLFITKVDLFFARKSATNGVTVQIREMTNGLPNSTIVPFGSVYLTASQVNAPSNGIAVAANTPTTVTFNAPIALKTNTEYCIVLIPDANDPDYLAFISRTGEEDIDTGLRITQDTNAGVLFTSTNNLTWTPYQNENIKFTLYAAQFTSPNGSVVLTDRDHEFFDIQSPSGEFTIAESVFINKNSFLTGTVSTVAGNTTLTGVGTVFTSEYQAGNHIVVRVNASTFDVLKIKAINNDTSLVLSDVPRYTANGVSHFTSPVGTLSYSDLNDPEIIILKDSTSKSNTFKFSNGDEIRGENSGSTATIVTVKDLPISYIQPAIYRSNFSKTRTSLTANRLYDGVSNENSKNFLFNSTNYLNDKTYYIRSKSNDFNRNSFELTVNMETSSENTSPVIDHEISSIMAVEYFVNSDATNETTNLGNASSKYISKRVELADGLDAEDFRLLLTAYKPTGTDIKVYARFQSQFDGRNFNQVEWTELVLKPETDTTSSLANRFDYREYDFSLGTTAKLSGEGAWSNSGTINYIDEIGAVYKDFKFFSLKIVMLSSGHNIVPRIKDLRAIALS